MTTLLAHDISLLFNVTGAKGKQAFYHFIRLKEAIQSKLTYFTRLQNKTKSDRPGQVILEIGLAVLEEQSHWTSYNDLQMAVGLPAS